MGLLDFFRRRPPIATPQDLAVFIDENAAFVVQKGIYEYSRARAGHYAKVLFGESGFRAAVEVSRWRAYPLGIAMVSEIAEGILRPHFGEGRQAGFAEFKELALDVFDRYPVPEALSKAEWFTSRSELDRRLDLIALHPPKPAMDVPEPFVDDYFALMPIHEKLRGRDYATTRNYLRVTLCNVHETLLNRVNGPAVAAALSAEAAQTV
jgi:hypothetical protein